MPVDLNAKPTCELGDFSSLTHPDSTQSGDSTSSSRVSPVMGGNSPFKNRDNPDPENPFSNSSDLRLRIEKAPTRVSKVMKTISSSFAKIDLTLIS